MLSPHTNQPLWFLTQGLYPKSLLPLPTTHSSNQRSENRCPGRTGPAACFCKKSCTGTRLCTFIYMENFSCCKGRAQQLRQRLEEPQSLGHLLLSTCTGRESPPRLCSGPKEGDQAPFHSSTLFLVPHPHPHSGFSAGSVTQVTHCHCSSPSPATELSSAYPEGTLSPAIQTRLLFREGMRLGCTSPDTCTVTFLPSPKPLSKCHHLTLS